MWEKITNRHIAEGKIEPHSRSHGLQHPRLEKPRRGLQIMFTPDRWDSLVTSRRNDVCSFQSNTMIL